MANIESIKQKILQLDAGAFQNLCDSYLYKTGYPNIVSLGGEAGTRKTTLGTPDTYFIASNGKYVFVEYTTQKTKLFTKIKEDLKKCLDTFNDYVRGGIEYMYTLFTTGCTSKDDYIRASFEASRNFKDSIDGVSYEDKIKRLLHK